MAAVSEKVNSFFGHETSWGQQKPVFFLHETFLCVYQKPVFFLHETFFCATSAFFRRNEVLFDASKLLFVVTK